MSGDAYLFGVVFTRHNCVLLIACANHFLDGLAAEFIFHLTEVATRRDGGMVLVLNEAHRVRVTVQDECVRCAT